MINLPKWRLTNPFPTHYDTESGSAIQQTAKVYKAMQNLVKEYNEFSEAVKNSINAHDTEVDERLQQFEIEFSQKFQDFIDAVEVIIEGITLELSQHIDNESNPHNVTAEDVGTYTKNEIDTALSEVGEKLEYINTITFAEDGRMAQIDTDHNGKPFELKKFVMFGRNLPSVSTTVSSGVVYVLATLLPDVEFEANGQYNLCSNGALSSSITNNWGAYYEVVAVEPDANRDDGNIAVIRGMKSPTTPFMTGIPDGCKGFNRLGVCTSSAKALFGAGSTIDIYGVRV